MRQLAVALVLFAAQAFGAATNINLRRLDYTNNVQFGAQQSREMLWYKGESVQYNVDVWRATEQVAIPSTASVIWQAWKSNNLSVLYIAATGEVVSADNGQVRVTLTPAQANLASGAYNSALSLWDGTNYIGMAGVGQIRVVWTPAGDALPYVGASAAAYVPKPTNTWTAGYVLTTSDGGTTTYATAQSGAGSGALTNILRGAGSSTRLSVSNGAGPQVTLNLDVSGLATGTPVYSLSGYATGTPIYAESDPVYLAGTGALWTAINSKGTGSVGSLSGVATSDQWRADTERVGLVATNAGNTAAQAQVLGTNAFTLAATASNLSASAVKYQDTRGFTNTGGARFSGAITADGGLSSTGSIRITNGDESNTISNTGIVLEGGGANPFRIANQIAQVSGTTVLNFGERRGYGSWTLGGEGAGELSGSVTIYASNLVWWNTSLFETGKLNAATLVGVDGSGLTNLPATGGAPQSPWTNTHDAAENVLTAAHLRVRSIIAGEGNSLGTGSNNVALVGGATFGNGSRGNVSAGQAINMGAGQNGFASGTNNTLGASYQSVGGRQNAVGAGNYAVLAGGFGNNIQGTAAFLGAGWYNTNSVGDYAVIDGGYQNRAQASYATVAGGATNWALAIGSTIAGGGGMTIASTGDYSFAYNAAPTNRQTFGAKQAAAFYVPGNFYVFNGSYAADNSVGISATNSVLIDAGAGTFTTQVWIFVKGIRVQ